MVALRIRRAVIPVFAGAGVVIISGAMTALQAGGSPRPRAVENQLPGLFDPRPLAETAASVEVEPVVSLPAQATVATPPRSGEPLDNVKPASAPPVLAEPAADTQVAVTATRHEVSPTVQGVRERSSKRRRVTSGHQVRNESHGIRSPKLRRVKAASSRRYRVSRLRARGVRGIGATMNATRYRVGGALKCFVRFNCTPRRIAGTAIGAAAGAAVGRGGGAVAGALIGAVVAGR
jgi:hypothetical protein